MRPVLRLAVTVSTLALGAVFWPLQATTEAPAAIRLRSGVMLSAGDDADLPPALLQSHADLTSGGPALLRFGPGDESARRAAAAAAGVRLEAYLGNGGFVAYLPESGLESIAALPGIDWSAPYHPGLRIAPAIRNVTADDSRETIPLTLHVFSHVDVARVAQKLSALGVQVEGAAPGRNASEDRARRQGKLVLLVSPADLVRVRDTVARWPETFWLDRRPRYRLMNDASAWVGQSGLGGSEATPVHDRGILGDGQVIGVLDTGLDADMCFFRDADGGLPPVNQGFGTGFPDPGRRKVTIVNFLWTGDDPLDPTDWDTQGHGTHVAGSAAGDDLATPGIRDAADGMAPAAKLVIQDGGYGVDDCADLPAIGCPAADLYPFFEQAWLQGARIHSNSYGDRENFTPFDIYSEGSEAADAMMWDHPEFLLVFAAGNNGPGAGTIASPATAKNVLAVGATAHGAAADSIASFSSEGPTHDGRIKPDVTIPGSSVVSAGNDFAVDTQNCGTQSSSGTSMACPTAAGFAALAREYYSLGFYPSGAASPGDGFTPSAALIKATLIASAAPMANVAAPPPSDTQGWGRILLDDALYFPGDTRRTFATDAVDRFASAADPVDLYSLDILDAAEPLRVSLAWTDYPSNPLALINLVNDLDLEVESPTGDVYRGNVFASGESQTGGAPDTVNNVEVIRVESPQAGTWTVRVRPSAIPQPLQGYGLVATGRLPVAGVWLERTALTLDDSVGGNSNAVLEPGEWVDLRLTLTNSGDTTATGVLVRVESLTAGVEVVQEESPLSDLATGQLVQTSDPQLRVRLVPGFTCAESVTLRFRFIADGFEQSEELTLPTGLEHVVLHDDLEGPTGWQHASAESDASTGDWTLGDPDGTAYQPEDDATPGAGSTCLFTAPNPSGVGGDDVDGGAVVARSGAYDLSGHPDVRLRISRWFANRDLGEDAGDFFRLAIREDAGSSDELLEELGSNESAPAWTAVDFKVADFVTPGANVELKVSAADGPAVGNIIEAAIDEIVFWEPACEIHDPAPNAVADLIAERDGNDVVLSWTRPALDPAHGESERFRVYRSVSPSGGFALEAEVIDPASTLSYTDVGAVGGPALLFYEVIAANAAGDSDTLP